MTLTLFDQEKLPYVKGSRTSLNAARKQLNRAVSDKERVLQTLREHPEGLTDWQGWPLSGIAQESTYRARRIGLRDEGFVVDSGRVASDERHEPSTVWVALENALGEGKTTAQVAAITGSPGERKTNAEVWEVMNKLQDAGLVTWYSGIWRKR